MAKKAAAKKNAVVATKGEVTKVVISKKLRAVVTLEIPAEMSHMIPIGEVNATFQSAQQSLDLDAPRKPYKDDDAEDEEVDLDL